MTDNVSFQFFVLLFYLRIYCHWVGYGICPPPQMFNLCATEKCRTAFSVHSVLDEQNVIERVSTAWRVHEPKSLYNTVQVVHLQLLLWEQWFCWPLQRPVPSTAIVERACACTCERIWVCNADVGGTLLQAKHKDVFVTHRCAAFVWRAC